MIPSSLAKAIYTTNRKKLLAFGLIVALIATIAVEGIVLAWSAGGTVGGVDWTGTSSVNYWADGGLVKYSGTSFTEAENVIDHLYVSSTGSRLCGPFTQGTDWNLTNNAYDTWITSRGGNGSTTAGSCSWYYPNPYIVVQTYGTHQVWNDSEQDSGDSNEFKVTPW